jgi:glycosyltransferase involved in cell wall biosynthesis
MAVRNGEAHLRDALDSVLAQSVADYEFVVVDDASTDGTPGILSEYRRQDSRIRILTNDARLGPYPSANRALLESRGSVIARHDADDISPQDRFAIQLDALRSDPDTSLVTGAVEIFGDTTTKTGGISRPPAWHPRLEWELLFTNVVGAGSQVMFPRVLRDKPVLFPAQHPFAEDYGLWCSLARLGRVVCPGQVVYRYRRHGASISSRSRAGQLESFARIRHSYQSQYLGSAVSERVTADVARFWTRDGSGAWADGVPAVLATLAELRARFLAYVGQRFGAAARARLDDEVDRDLSDRLSYWLFRSMRCRDYRACGDLLGIARSRGESLSVARDAVGQVVSGVARRVATRGGCV